MKYMVSIKCGAVRAAKKAKPYLKQMHGEIKKGLKTAVRMMCRVYAIAAAHKESLGYYAVLTLVLVALGAAANDYRSRKLDKHTEKILAKADPGIVVQTQPDQTLSPESKPAAYVMPVQGTIVTEFSDSELTWSTTLQLWQTHPALDISASVGETVTAAADGIVVEAYADALYGNVIVVEHDDGSILRYCSLNTLQMVKTGQRVSQHDIIGSVGTCRAEEELGAHIHLEYMVDGKTEDFSDMLDTAG